MSERDETIACRAGVDSDPAQGAVMPPIYLSANYSFAEFGQKRDFDYTRSGNPTRSVLADAIAKLEGGAGAVITSSGMSAVDLVLSQLPANALVVATHDCYGGSWRLFEARARKGQIRVKYVNLRDNDATGAALDEGPALLWIETPSNPLMRIADIASLAKRAKAAGARVAVDNTFLSPVRSISTATPTWLAARWSRRLQRMPRNCAGGPIAPVSLGRRLTRGSPCAACGRCKFG
jgi:cystathionine gamma-synthase